MLELRHLRTLLALRAAGSLVKAAQLLNLTQSALSHQIKLMEERYETPVFERKSMPIAFTATGSRLLALADLVLPTIDAAERDIARLASGGSGQLRVLLAAPACIDWLMPVMDAFRQRWPEVALDLLAEAQGEPAELLRSGQAELVIGAACGPEFALFPLFRYEVLVALAHGHRLQGRRRLAAADFERETLITHALPDERVELIRDVLRPAGVRFERRMVAPTVAILQLVASRRGLAPLPAWALRQALAEDYVLARPVGQHGLWSELAVSTPRALDGNACVADFVNLIRQHCAGALDGITLLAQPAKTAEMVFP